MPILKNISKYLDGHVAFGAPRHDGVSSSRPRASVAGGDPGKWMLLLSKIRINTLKSKFLVLSTNNIVG
jgi:hypothetical protein